MAFSAIGIISGLKALPAGLVLRSGAGKGLCSGVSKKSLEELCLACGMCCDGTLFDGVQLEASDDGPRLKQLGLPVKVSRGRTPIARFAQPCAALGRDCTCRVYAGRPWQCRVFECGVFKKAKAGELDFATARRRVQQGRRLADRVRKLLRALGDHEEHRALGERFFRMQCRMEEQRPDAAALATFADLSLAVHRLKLLAHENFYTQSDKSSAPPKPML